MWSRHQEWLESFWSNVAATVLGIVLTFGVSEWLDRREERLNAEALVERSFKNIDARLRNIDSSIDILDQQDSILIMCSKALPDHLDEIPTETFRELINIMCLRYYSMESKSVETGFKQDINSQKILGDFADVLADAFEAIKYGEAANENINDLKLKFQQLGTKYWLTNENTMSMSREECIALLTNPDALYYMSISSTNAQLMRRISHYLHNYIKEAHALWNDEITYEEFVKRAVKEQI